MSRAVAAQVGRLREEQLDEAVVLDSMVFGVRRDARRFELRDDRIAPNPPGHP